MQEEHFETICSKLKNLEDGVRGHKFNRKQMQELGRLVKRFADIANTSYDPKLDVMVK